MAKTDWQMEDKVQPEDLNQIGQEINDNAADLLDHKSAAVLDHPDGSVTTEKLADGAVTASKVAADVAKTADLAAHANTTSGAHGATSAATPNTIVQRDPVGRFKAAAPAAADDVARLAEVMAAESSIENTLLPTLQSVKTKTDLIGTTGDGTSTASLFGRLAAVKGKTDLIGTVSDASGTASVFGKFADIKAKTDLIGSTSDGTPAGTVFGKFATIKAKTDLIGSTSDAAGTTTVFGRLADVKAKTDLIGATGDSSSASTVFGRLAAVKTKTDLIGATGDSSATATVFGRLAAIKEKTDLINNGSNSLELEWSSSIKPYNVAYLSTNGSNTLDIPDRQHFGRATGGEAGLIFPVTTLLIPLSSLPLILAAFLK
jgi:hypothetical protein